MKMEINHTLKLIVTNCCTADDWINFGIDSILGIFAPVELGDGDLDSPKQEYYIDSE